MIGTDRYSKYIMKKLLLINPSYRNDVLEGVKVLSAPPLSLATIAGCTKGDYEITILDEHLQIIDFNIPADLVGITCMTPLAPRAYQIAAEFRNRNIPVILGGIHASMLPQEAAQYVDSVVTGEAEEIWPQVLKDFEAGSLQSIYHGGRVKVENIVRPRHDLLSKKYFIPTVQTSRGCPYNCDFCSVTRFNGGTYRLRPVKDVIEEIKGLSQRRFFFTDDNIIGSGEKCIKRSFQLFDELSELKAEWGSQICITIADNDKLLKAAADSGAKWFFIGFESVNPQSLLDYNKKVNFNNGTLKFKEAIKKIQNQGIAVVGGFILGSDNDTQSVFNQCVEFVEQTGIDVANYTIQTPFPGTKLHEAMIKQDRIFNRNFPADWKNFSGFDVVFKPKNMTIDELRIGHADVLKATSSLGKSIKRAISTFSHTKSLFPAVFSFFWNYDCYKAITKKLKINEELRSKASKYLRSGRLG